MKLEVKCAQCARVLGYYEGESFSVYPSVDFMKVVCDRCLGKNMETSKK